MAELQAVLSLPNRTKRPLTTAPESPEHMVAIRIDEKRATVRSGPRTK